MVTKKSKLKRVVTAKTIYNRHKRLLRKDEDTVKLKKELKNITEQLKLSDKRSDDLEDELIEIFSKECSDPEELIYSLPIENLNDLYDRSYKANYNDIVNLTKLRENHDKLNEEKINLLAKKKLLKIELLEQRISVLLKDFKDES